MRAAKMEQLSNQVILNGQPQSSEVWGKDYLPEYRRILQQYVKPVTRAFLEWGCGNTTLAIIQWRESLAVDNFFSIEHSAEYLAQMVPQFPAWSGFHPIHQDVTGPTHDQHDQGLNYSTLPLTLGTRFDFIFIDGRRRLECAFVASLLCHPDTIVVLHDYHRRRYQPVKALYEILEDGSQFRVMRLRPNVYGDAHGHLLSREPQRFLD
jgi:hypothetical protein